MPKNHSQVRDIWRHSWQLKGVRSRVIAAINASKNGATVTMDLKTAMNLVEVCDQAIWTEQAQEPTSDVT